MKQAKEIILHLAGDNEFKIMMSPADKDALIAALSSAHAKEQNADMVSLAQIARKENLYALFWSLFVAILLFVNTADGILSFLTGIITLKEASLDIVCVISLVAFLITVPINYRMTNETIERLSPAEAR